MRIVVFGTGPFCVPSLAALQNSPHQVVAVVTRPIEDPGKRRKTAANPVRDFAEQHRLPVIDPVSCNSDDAVDSLRAHEADLFFVCDYGQILSNACLQAARLGGINLHGSLLPKYRGAAPINWALYHGEQETGATVIHMTPQLDAGPSLTTVRMPIGARQTAVEIETELSQLGVGAVLEAIEMLESWDGQSALGDWQDPKLATRAPRLKKTDGKINWERTAEQIVNQIRAFQPWPNSYCHWHQGKQPVRMIIHAASVMPIETDAPPGVVVAIDKKILAVQTGKHALSIEQIQPAGKRSMEVLDFLRGAQIQVGQVMD